MSTDTSWEYLFVNRDGVIVGTRLPDLITPRPRSGTVVRLRKIDPKTGDEVFDAWTEWVVLSERQCDIKKEVVWQVAYVCEGTLDDMPLVVDDVDDEYDYDPSGNHLTSEEMESMLDALREEAASAIEEAKANAHFYAQALAELWSTDRGLLLRIKEEAANTAPDFRPWTIGFLKDVKEQSDQEVEEALDKLRRRGTELRDRLKALDEDLDALAQEEAE